MFYSPNEKYNLHGEITTAAQQMDIYPTLADLMGYNKPIRSWGRSLVSGKNEDYLIVNSDSINEQMMIGNYIYLFNGENVTGIYSIDDKALKNNVIKQPLNQEMKRGILLTKAWYQDYMDRVINRKLK